MAIAIAILLGFSLLCTYAIGRNVSRALTSLSSAMRMLAAGGTNVELAESGRRREIRIMASAVEVFRKNAIENRALHEAQKASSASFAEGRRQDLLRLACSFEADVKAVMDNVTSGIMSIETSAEKMSDIAETTEQKTSIVATEMNDASANVTIVASAAEELKASIQEISRQANVAQAVVGRAVDASERSGRTVEKPGDRRK